ncbi:MAG: HAD family phosphatase [Planctomycetes bacterium]|nr:HAD family phosphatase [Planctomycetota bacterium]
MKIRLVAVDLDGTLLNSEKEITGVSAAILREARRQAGVRIVLASARPPRTVLPFHELLALDSPMINYNGALVFDPPSGRVLMHRPIPAKIAMGIVRLARRMYPDVLVSGEVMDRWFTDRFEPTYTAGTDRQLGPDAVQPVEKWANQSLTKLLLIGQADWMRRIAAAILRQFPYQVGIVQTEDYMLQVMHATVSKAQALRVVAAELGISRQQVMAIGDNANDVGMLQWAGVAVAMANAAPETRAAADYVTEDHDADGAALAIRRIILEGQADR